MREQVEAILQLQPEWTSLNSPAMQRRGQLIRSDLTAWLRVQLPELQMLVPAGADDLQIEGRDGTGRKSRVPWARIYSEGRSESATIGFYLAYLFSAAGGHCYLALMQGTTRWENGEFHPRPADELRERVDWARDVAAAVLTSRPELFRSIDLESSADLARGYERGTVAAFGYASGAVPDDDQLLADLRELTRALGEIYKAEDSSLDMPGEPAPEVADAISVVEHSARPRAESRSQRARMRLSAAERSAIEERAVGITVDHLEGCGYAVTDVGASMSYDLDAKRHSEHLYVEVKGTTSDGAEVVLTRNEVELNAREFPNTMLALVTGIELDRLSDPPVASGGLLRTIHPWHVEPSALESMAYRYEVPLPADL